MQKRGLELGRFVDPSRRRNACRPAFTLIELLVVVAIIAVLISILLPSLSSARKGARATVCATNQRQVGQAVAIYLASNNDIYPMSYVYPSDPNGNYDPTNQPVCQAPAPYGYIHWSWLLYNRGQVPDGAFHCPEIPNGGHPRSNPGPRAENWLSGQVDDNGATVSASSLEDRQAPFVAFTGNAAVFPRNKFGENCGGTRQNKFVRNSDLAGSTRAVILATEFNPDFESVLDFSQGSGRVSKAHRPINPFDGISGGTDEYAAPASNLEFSYAEGGNINSPDTAEKFGLLPAQNLRRVEGLIAGRRGRELNAVGRQHPGGDSLGGSTNFLYIDGSSSRKTILQTMIGREWGSRYYSITGRNEVMELTAQAAGL